MAALTDAQQEAAFARGADALMRIAGKLEPGQHLLGCRVDLAGGVSVPARVLINVTGPELDDLIGMEPEQMTMFAIVLGAGLMDPRTEHCDVMLHSKATPDATPVEQAWEMIPTLTPDTRWLRPLSAFEARNRYTPERADADSLTFRSAFELNAEDEFDTFAENAQHLAAVTQRRKA